MAVGPPPQPKRPESALRRAAIAFALIGLDAAAPQRNRNSAPPGGEPAPAAIAGRGANADQGKRPMDGAHCVSH